MLGKEMGDDGVNDIGRVYDELSSTYEETYVHGGIDNKYIVDEVYAARHFFRSGIKGRIVSLGVGSGQDIEILGHPSREDFVGYDVSEGMLNNGLAKFPDYDLRLHDCNEMIPGEHGDVLVSMFGAANYLGADKLVEHYRYLGCRSAFFVFYNEHYHDEICDDYHVYDQDRLRVAFSEFDAQVKPLFDGSNYYVVWWNESN